MNKNESIDKTSGPLSSDKSSASVQPQNVAKESTPPANPPAVSATPSLPIRLPENIMASELPARIPEIALDALPKRQPETVIKVVVPKTSNKSDK